jgi:protein tyrosine/serine phosphatase
MPLKASPESRWLLLSFLVGGILALGIIWVPGSRGLPPTDGILNFGKIDERIYRGARPDDTSLATLQKLGVKTIIDLRMPGEVWKLEGADALARGIFYTNVPLPGFSRPADAQMQKLLGMLDTLPGPIFVHCQHGCDRTGTLIACYRIRHAQWPASKALKEAKDYGISILEQGMLRYVRDFDRDTKVASSSHSPS